MAEFDAIPIKRGDTRTLRITATWPVAVEALNVEAGDPYPLNGKDLSIEARIRRDEPEMVFHKTEDSPGVTVLPAPNDNVALVKIGQGDTESLDKTITLKIDVRVTSEADGTRWTVADGDLKVEL